MAGAFATTVFSSGAQDSYRVADVYSQSGKGTISSYQDRSSVPATTGLGSLFGGGTTGFNLSTVDALKTAQNTLAYGKGVMAATDTKSALDRAIGSAGSLASNLRSAPGGLQNALMGAISGTQNVYATIGNTVARLKSGNLPDIRSVTGMINTLAGQTNPGLININDKNSIVGLAAGLVQQATAYGIPKSFSALSKNLMGNPTLIAGVVDKIMPTISKGGRIRELKDVTSIAPLEVKMSKPDILGDFSFNYQKEDGTVGTSTTEFNDIKDTYTKIDPSWNSTTRAGGNALDLSCFANASSDMKDTLKIGALNSTNVDDKLYLLADHIPKDDPRDQLKSAFPLTAYSNFADPEPQIQSPISIAQTNTKPAVVVANAGGRDITVQETVFGDGSSKKVITTSGDFLHPEEVVTKYYNPQGQETSVAGEPDTWGATKKVDFYIKEDIEHTVYEQKNNKGVTRVTTTRSFVESGIQLEPLIVFK